jgi:glycosyl transferase family 25
MTAQDSSNSPWNKCGVFLINLDRSPERLALATENFSKVGMPFQRIAGFDASKEDVSLCQIDQPAFTRIHGKKLIRKGEIGCYQSHLRAIQAFLATEKDFAIILEDDALPLPHAVSTIAQLIEWKSDWDIVPLFHFHSGGPVTLKHSGNLKLTVHLAHISSSAAYMINRRAAQVLIKHMAVQRACVDHALFENWAHGLRLRGIRPMAMQLSAQANISTINAENSGKLAIWRRLPTFLARTHVAVRLFFFALKELTNALIKTNKNSVSRTLPD